MKNELVNFWGNLRGDVSVLNSQVSTIPKASVEVRVDGLCERVDVKETRRVDFWAGTLSMHVYKESSVHIVHIVRTRNGIIHSVTSPNHLSS